MRNDKPWKTLTSKVVYQNPWMQVHEDDLQMPNGAKGIYGFIDSKPGVFVIAITKDEKIHLVESYRYPTQKWQWELPTGGIEQDMTPLESAQHELAGELGITASNWTQINTFGPSSNGFMNDTQTVFVAKDLQVSQQQLEAFEAIRATKVVSRAELMAMIADGTLANGQSLAALLQFIVWAQFSDQ